MPYHHILSYLCGRQQPPHHRGPALDMFGQCVEESDKEGYGSLALLGITQDQFCITIVHAAHCAQEFLETHHTPQAGGLRPHGRGFFFDLAVQPRNPLDHLFQPNIHEISVVKQGTEGRARLDLLAVDIAENLLTPLEDFVIEENDRHHFGFQRGHTAYRHLDPGATVLPIVDQHDSIEGDIQHAQALAMIAGEGVEPHPGTYRAGEGRQHVITLVLYDVVTDPDSAATC